MSEPDQPVLTYGEFTKRRSAIVAEITALQKKLGAILDPAYTMMAPEGVSLLELQLATARERLTMLVAAWELQQRRSAQS